MAATADMCQVHMLLLLVLPFMLLLLLMLFCMLPNLADAAGKHHCTLYACSVSLQQVFQAVSTSTVPPLMIVRSCI